MIQFAQTPLFCEMLCTVVGGIEDVLVSSNPNPVDIYEDFFELCWDRKSTVVYFVSKQLRQEAHERYAII